MTLYVDQKIRESLAQMTPAERKADAEAGKALSGTVASSAAVVGFGEKAYEKEGLEGAGYGAATGASAALAVGALGGPIGLVGAGIFIVGGAVFGALKTKD